MWLQHIYFLFLIIFFNFHVSVISAGYTGVFETTLANYFSTFVCHFNLITFLNKCIFIFHLVTSHVSVIFESEIMDF